MPLTAADIEAYTAGRLDSADPETARVLAAELAAARNYCGWHVTPVVETSVVLDGPGSRGLVLPTLKLVELTSLTEDGVQLVSSPLSPGFGNNLRVSVDGRIEKASGGWTRNMGGITAAFTHGYTDAAAADFESVILSAVERALSQNLFGGVRAIGPFQFGATSAASTGSAYTIAEQDTLDRYRLNSTFA